MQVRETRRLYLLIGFFSLCITALLIYSSVDTSLSEEDKQYIGKFLSTVEELPKSPTFQDELDFIRSVQQSVLDLAPTSCGLPVGQEREPKDLYEAKAGWCYDRSRVIEKILRSSGFEVRHISLYSNKQESAPALPLLSPNVSSHAVTEVLTKNGWLVVDSNEKFVSVDKGGKPISLKEIQLSAEGRAVIEWETRPRASIYSCPFIFVYGLYSRHGQFYPPYNVIPDINDPELFQHVF